MIRNILLCGVGGQGILLGAKIIACAAEHAGFQVATNEIHGMAQRGGSVTAQIRYGEQIHSPLIPEGAADVLASLEAVEALRCCSWLRPGGLAVAASTRIIPVTVSSGAARYPADIEERLRRVFSNLKYFDFCAAAAELGNLKLANTVMLGALSNGLAGIDVSVWERAIAECVKPRFVDMNTAAFHAGRKA